MATRYLDESVEKFKQLERVIKSGFKITSEIAEDLEIGDESVKEMRELMIGYAALEQNMKNCLKAAQNTKSTFETNMIQSDEQQQQYDYQKLFNQTLDDLDKAVDVENLVKHKRIKAFDDTVMKQHFGDDATGNTSEETEMTGEDGDEIEMTQDESQRFICPITKVEMEDPVKNNNCGHNYSRAAVEAHIRNNRNRVQGTRCPVAGCAHNVTRDSLEDDPVLAYKIRRANKD